MKRGYEYVFKNAETGELRRASSYALVPAARSLGIAATLTEGRYDLSPWVRWECWQGNECIWHYDDAETLHSGER